VTDADFDHVGRWAFQWRIGSEFGYSARIFNSELEALAALAGFNQACLGNL
jgi:hypothetical protein